MVGTLRFVYHNDFLVRCRCLCPFTRGRFVDALMRAEALSSPTSGKEEWSEKLTVTHTAMEVIIGQWHYTIIDEPGPKVLIGYNDH